jgi:hypothetical protein
MKLGEMEEDDIGRAKTDFHGLGSNSAEEG